MKLETKTEVRHTPTPWYEHSIQAGWRIHAEGKMDNIGTLYGASDEFSFEEAKANKDFVFRAVNNHDALVAALKLFVEGGNTNGLHFQQAKDALKAAGEEI